MKRFTIIFLLLAAGAFVFAGGSRENQRPALDGEVVGLSGIIDLSKNPPVLTSAGEEYLVMVPRILQSEIDIKDGAELSLEGYVHEGTGRYTTDRQVISVTRAIIDGVEYDVETYRQGSAVQGMRAGAVAGGGKFSNQETRGSSGKPGAPRRR